MKPLLALICTGLLCIASSKTALARDSLPIGYTAITGIKAGLWVAEEAGIFEKYNIQPHLILITSGSKMVQAMLGGDLPLAGAAGNAAVDATLAGADIVMIGALAKVPAFYIMALPEIKSIEDLRGKSVAVTRFGSSTDFTMRYLLRKHGMNPERDVTMVQTGDIFAAAAGWRAALTSTLMRI
jgi:NitT/TauT family transport system substrate-binding protein